ncbi:hypothetical protein GV64_08300 [Endozoicomonas elysicola]|uniref:Uncharacterized protein n=1 Tax=Endozoicomonas elysicola TaxID=305900 RepID=A0A081K9B7_9GAMM|nr:hypothetical protein GV64_08300 [Endozoicomonas elysicola]
MFFYLSFLNDEKHFLNHEGHKVHKGFIRSLFIPTVSVDSLEKVGESCMQLKCAGPNPDAQAYKIIKSKNFVIFVVQSLISVF